MSFAIFVIAVATAAAIKGWAIAMSRVPTPHRQYGLGITSSVLTDAMASYRAEARYMTAQHKARETAVPAAAIRERKDAHVWEKLQEEMDEAISKEWAARHRYNDEGDSPKRNNNRKTRARA